MIALLLKTRRIMPVFGLLLTLLIPIPAQAATLPPNFTQTLFADGLNRPTAMAFAPDGRLFIALQDGAVRVVKDGTLLPDPAISLNVNSIGERGLIGLAFHPRFPAQPYLYLHYTHPDPLRNRVSRFTVNGDRLLPDSERVLIQMGPLGPTNHNGGALHFGVDGRLYIAVGDNNIPAKAQTLSNRQGKLLRLNPDGSIPTDNPFFTRTNGRNRAIWALGLRNPFTFAVQPGSGHMFINDVGQRSFEEVNRGVRGGNYGWPDTEGYHDDPRYIAPVHAYGREGGACSIAGGTFYNPTQRQFPVAYTGAYFFADFCAAWIRMLDVPTGTVTPFAEGLTGRPVDLRVGPDGALYVLARGSGSADGTIQRIAYTGGQAGDELIQNGGFETPLAPGSTLPADWTTLDGTINRLVCNRLNRPNDLPDRLLADEGACAFRLFAGGGTLVQVINGAGLSAGDTLHLSMTARLINAPAGGLLRAQVRYTDGSTDNLRVRFPAGTYGYAGRSAAPYTIAGAVDSIRVIIRYEGTAGSLTVDRVSLRRENGLLPLPQAAGFRD